MSRVTRACLYKNNRVFAENRAGVGYNILKLPGFCFPAGELFDGPLSWQTRENSLRGGIARKFGLFFPRRERVSYADGFSIYSAMR